MNKSIKFISGFLTMKKQEGMRIMTKIGKMKTPINRK